MLLFVVGAWRVGRDRRYAQERTRKIIGEIFPIVSRR
jgi:hypothetical protein